MLNLPQVRAHKQHLQPITIYASWYYWQIAVNCTMRGHSLQIPLWTNSFFNSQYCQQICSHNANRLVENLPKCESTTHEGKFYRCKPSASTIPWYHHHPYYQCMWRRCPLWERGFTLLGVRPKLGITNCHLTVKKQTANSEAGFPTAYMYEIEHRNQVKPRTYYQCSNSLV